ncbi:MAG: oligosaccharide flippase family protein, partial [Clostridia bacterium]|nr:oligosaccharide flippase family protein [Clostridia bacterium]
GFNTALIQKKDADNTDFSTRFFSSLGLSVLLYIVLFFTKRNSATVSSRPSCSEF